MKKYNTVNLQINTIHFPITAIVSIIHRISGTIIFINIGLLLWLFKLSISSENNFAKVIDMLNNKTCKMLIWSTLTALTYHIICGMRHILMDIGCLNQTLSTGNTSAKIIIILTILLSILIGIIIW